MKVLAQREKCIPWVLGILEQEITVIWFFFFDDDTCGLGFGYGGWSGDHEVVMLYSLGQYRQLQFVDLPEVSSALAVLHDQFLGDP